MMNIEEKRPEWIKDTIAVTWCPNGSFQTNDPQIGYKMAVYVLKNLKHVSDEIKLYPELTAQGNIHFHGTIKLKDKIKWYKCVLPKLKRNGFIKIKTNVDEHWDDYCKKEWDIFKEVLELDNPIDYQYLSKIKIPTSPTSQNILDITQRQIKITTMDK